jgi:hypothetical protein
MAKLVEDIINACLNAKIVTEGVMIVTEDNSMKNIIDSTTI